MHGPAVVSWLLALVCAATGSCCLALSRRGPAGARATARIEAAMGLSMAAMALPGGAEVLPAGLFVGLFAGMAAWSAWSALGPARTAGHRGHGLHHTLEALAMAYMAVVMLRAGGGALPAHHSAAGGIPALTGGLLLYLAVFALHTGARLVPVAAGSGTPAGTGWPTAPGPALTDACRLTLALGSFTMLLTL